MPFSRSLITLILLAAVIAPSFFVHALTPTEEREALEAELRELEKEIQRYEDSITETRAKKQTLQNQIAIIESQIKKLNLQIYQSNVLINDLQSQIQDTAYSIGQTQKDVENSKEQLGKLLQLMYQEDQKSPIEIILSGSELSDFFDNVAALEFLNSKNRELLEDLQELQTYLEQQKETLEQERQEEENFARIQVLQKEQTAAAQAKRQELLEETRGEEARYQEILTDRTQKAQEIRARIFELIGVPEAPTFGEAVEIARAVSQQTGVRPAFLLAILTQESDIGKNVGQCTIADTTSGASIGINTGKRFSNGIHPTRDLPRFLAITQELGRDPMATPVSCPLSYGYGGAMGPAQFIPSTWALYADRLSSILGRPADPWSIKDAFLASALYLSDLGASKQTYSAEWCAAVSYFSGSCQTRYRFYGDSVLSLAARYESDIRILEGN